MIDFQKDENKKQDPKHEFDREIENKLSQHIIDSELKIATKNKQKEVENFDSYMDMMDGIRREKNYDWQSDINVPEFIIQAITQNAIDASKYFSTRDFTETYIEDESDQAIAAAEAQKELINRTLNQKHLYHYLKFIRARGFSNVTGNAYTLCRWEQKLKREVVGTREVPVELDVDDFGDAIVDPEIQSPAIVMESEDVIDDVVVYDRFNYDVIDNRNIFFSNEYTYSIQQKKYIFVRKEITLQEILDDEKNGIYFNGDVVKNMVVLNETKTSSETYNKNADDMKESNPLHRVFDLYMRFGKYWVIVLERDENDIPTKIEPGINKEGKIKKEAKLLQVIFTFVKSGSDSVLIGLQYTPFIDAHGEPYIPIIRGIGYIHLTDDGGVGDGKYSREMQVGINDSINMANDRTSLATIPTFKSKKYAVEDTSSLYFEPGHNWELKDPGDVEVFEINDNSEGAMQRVMYYTDKMHGISAMDETAQGRTPASVSTSATAVVGANQRTEIRTNYKLLTFENTYLTELYWMIGQMTWTFARPETAEKLMGSKVYDFDPSLDYFYKPVSASIETDASKDRKLSKIDLLMSRIVQLQHPDSINIINHLITMTLKILGDEYVNFGNKLLNPAIPAGEMGRDPEAGAQAMASNQYGMPQSAEEQGAREAVSF